MASKSSVRWGICSTATICDKVCPALQAAEASEVVVVASRSEEKARAWADARGVPNTTTYDALPLSEVDAVYVPLPSGLRNQQLLALIAAGKHVYSEKPMDGSVEEIRSILAAAEQANVQFMDGTMWYHSQRTRQIECAIREGAIGAVRRVTASFTFLAPDPEWLHGGNGRTDKSREPMGCFGDQGWYPLSAILFAYGFEMPTKVLMTDVKLNKVDTIVSCGGVLWFANGRMATFDAGCMAPHRSQYEIVGEKGTISVGDLVGGQGRSGNFAAYEGTFAGSTEYTLGDGMGKDTIVSCEPCDHARALVEDFNEAVRAIRAGGSPNSDWPHRTLAVHSTMCALMESMKCGGVVELQPTGSCSDAVGTLVTEVQQVL